MRAAAELEDVDVAVVRAAFAVAETGSIFLSEAALGLNALGYLAQHLVALLDPADILGNLHHAYRHPASATARYAVLMSGPSATADIEGVLICGAQGVRSLKVLPIPRRVAGFFAWRLSREFKFHGRATESMSRRAASRAPGPAVAAKKAARRPPFLFGAPVFSG